MLELKNSQNFILWTRSAEVLKLSCKALIIEESSSSASRSSGLSRLNTFSTIVFVFWWAKILRSLILCWKNPLVYFAKMDYLPKIQMYRHCSQLLYQILHLKNPAFVASKKNWLKHRHKILREVRYIWTQYNNQNIVRTNSDSLFCIFFFQLW